jgi:hypothetical protein
MVMKKPTCKTSLSAEHELLNGLVLVSKMGDKVLLISFLRAAACRHALRVCCGEQE